MATEANLKKRFKIKILGEEMVVVADVSEEYVRKLAEHINTIGEEINRTYPRLVRQRVLGLTIMNITDEYYKLKETYNKNFRFLKKLKSENKSLKEKLKKLNQENDELMELLEEAD